jgi:hypothetical protein
VHGGLAFQGREDTDTRTGILESYLLIVIACTAGPSKKAVVVRGQWPASHMHAMLAVAAALMDGWMDGWRASLASFLRIVSSHWNETKRNDGASIDHT